ncbi:MAG: diguanylate cyclase [Rubellimicrobium sp.]|nr:diguanylate cyclase [Rubellimicrobium sp.]
MSGQILIVETSLCQRIHLRGVLESAHYEVALCRDLAAAARIAAEGPGLVLIDISRDTQAALALIAALRGSDDGAAVPVIALASQPAPELRLAALRAGADDVLDRRGETGFLLARIRSLLRVRDAAEDLRLGGGAARALGMADAVRSFVPAGRTVILTRRPEALPAGVAALAQRLPGGAVVRDPSGDFASGAGTVDLFVIDHEGGADNGAATAGLFRLIADLQSRPATRRAKALVVVPDHAPALGEMALDLGADDLVPDSVRPDELTFRVRALLRRKNQADSRRDRLQSGLAAALTDPLTGLFNRRYAMAELAGLTERLEDGGAAFSVLLLDIDHFKRVNDTWGHAAGDAILRGVAGLLRGNLRAVDMVARIGGEEFLVILPDTPPEAARRAAERLRRVVESAVLETGTGRQDTGGQDARVRVTLSVGVATGQLPAPGTDAVASLLDRADRALYAAKSAGRNQVTAAAISAA